MKKIILTLLTLSFLSPVFAQDRGQQDNPEQRGTRSSTVPVSDETKIGEILENNTELKASKFLSESDFNIYSKNRIRVGDGFNYDKPLEFHEVRDLSHPYLQERVNLIRGKDLEELAKLRMDERFKDLRSTSIYNEGLKYGSQSALYKSMYEFNEDMKAIGDYYDRVFNFGMFMLANGRVQPPVLVVRGSSLIKEDDYTLRRTDGAYKIFKQAKVVTRPPSYVDYLTFSLIKPVEPNILLMPRPYEADEIKAWSEGVADGWSIGVRQANSIINEGLYSLLRDYYGMAQFYLASQSGMISMPDYQEMNLGITTDGNNLQVGEEIFSITILPQFNNKGHTWVPIPEVENFLELNLNRY